MNERGPLFTIKFDTVGLPHGGQTNLSRGAITLEEKSPEGVTTFTKTLQFFGLQEIPKRIQELLREYESRP